ncbi:T9SS type A sorting domain-containing protein [uncultured Parabacteroides sp.]|uniref:T9SS type A sorting domain-containing protein n=1 Tax=uncultured Parabacteroides sp. TaxID=512312 RepID=UPI002635292C|nr:T9SS type A sorting domain-containing protein [uncultured Parabacteroides sp.]
MKRNKLIYDRWLRVLFLSFALLVGGGGWIAWGEKTFTGPVSKDGSNRPKIIMKDHESVISLNNGTTMRMGHDSVFHEVKTIYARMNQARRLFIPELRLCIANKANNNEKYNWFVHWYVVDRSNGNAVNIDNSNIQFSFKEEVMDQKIARMQGGDWDYEARRPNSTNNEEHNSTDNDEGKHLTEDFFIEEQNGGWVWSKRLRQKIWKKNYNEYGGGYGMDASTIYFTVNNDEAFNKFDIYCDISIYQDGTWEESTEENVAGIYMEPTLTKRFIYRLQNATNGNIPNEPEVFKFDYPYDESNKTINFSMPYMPDNYFWGNYQGKHFEYKYKGEEDSEYRPFRLVSRQNALIPFQQTQRILGGEDGDKYSPTDSIVIYVRVSDSDDSNGNKSDPMAKFVFNPLLNSGFKLGTDINNDDFAYRWPRRHSEKYKLIGSVDFDNNDVVDKLVGFSNANSENANNMSQRPFGYYSENQTSYGFLRKDAYTLLHDRKWAPQGNNLSITNNQNIYGLYRSAGLKGISAHGDICYKGHSEEDNVDWSKMYIWPTASTDLTLYDRTYMISQDREDADYEENKVKYGYFYYIDASKEAGTLVEVPVDNICPNTELTVTAWIADMTRPRTSSIGGISYNPLAPNVNLIFKGFNAERKEVILHQFTSCDALVDYGNVSEDLSGNITNEHNNSNLFKWQQLCYSFVVDDLKGCTEFYLEVQNNEPHTDGADYAIDDIRVFMRKPEVEIVQAGNLCDTEVKTVRYGTSYSNIMRVMGLKENQEVKSPNDDVHWADPNDPLPQKLVDYINDKYADRQEDAMKHFTKIYYSVYEKENLERPLEIDYDGDGEKELYRVSYLSTIKDDMAWVDASFSFDSKNSADKIYSLPLDIGEAFDPEKEYVARITTQPLGNNYESIACGSCALIGDPFRISVAGDRFTIYSDESVGSEITKPENVEQGKTYKIVGNFRYLDSGTWTTLENAKFDWFIGTLEEFNTSKVTIGNTEYTIQEALNVISTSKDKDTRENIKNALVERFGEYESTENDKKGKFVFGKYSFDYTMVNKYQLIVGLPRAIQDNDVMIAENLYCAKPVEIKLGGTPPIIDPGDPDVPDPKDPEDPNNHKDPDPKDDPKDTQPDKDSTDGSHVRSVRVGLIQIKDMLLNNGTLRIPIYSRKSEKNEIFVVDKTNQNIMVYQTSDILWKETESVAKLIELGDQYVDMNNAKPTWNENYFKIQFNQMAVNKFREGFWYMVNIPYAVKNTDEDKIVYNGIMKLTLKIVPEYVTWVGSETDMYNWNNDGPSHWRRSNDKELYTIGVANKSGSHNEAYVPMRFTKVTVYGKAQKEGNDYNLNGNAYAAHPHLYELKKQTSLPILNMKAEDEIGAATKNIEYDLLADPDYEKELFGSFDNPDKKDDVHNYACVRFYGNTCDDIYIKPESEILHTEYLTYDTAHVDYEMDPNRWYMLASPLRGVVSGDMYLPTGTGTGQYARQETPAFEKINYEDNTKYTRWAPAVYMRGWKKSKAWVIHSSGINNPVNYAISTGWSNLYNDVDVSFASGTGFSIGTKAESSFSGKVLFRLPKNDNSYSYYASDNTTNDNKELTSENREGNGRFLISPDEMGSNPVTSHVVDTVEEMFGNPFMSHLNMKTFFEVNGRSEGTYYILNDNKIISNVMGKDYTLSTSDGYNGEYIAPLQSFIVPNMTKATFTTDMIAKAPATGKPGLRSATSSPADEPLPQLRITATRDGVRNTAVVAGLVTASDSYVEGEDAALLINEEVAAPQVYTLAGNQMTAINVTPELAEIPLGIYGKNATPVELSFKVSGAMKNVKLVDKQTGKRYDVTDGLTLTVPGNTSGRYVLNGSIATSNEIVAQGRIIFYNSAPGRIDISSVDPLNEVTVYDVSGRALRTLRNLNTPTTSVDHLAPGIYVVRAESGSQVVSEKVEVK